MAGQGPVRAVEALKSEEATWQGYFLSANTAEASRLRQARHFLETTVLMVMELHASQSITGRLATCTADIYIQRPSKHGGLIDRLGE